MNTSDAGAEPQVPLLPEADISAILGLLELLKSKGGREEIYKLSTELSMDVGETLTVIRAAELLGFVHTPGGDVVLEKKGENLTEVDVNERKAMIKSQIEKIPVIQKICRFLREQEDHEADREEVLEVLAELIPNDDAEDSFSAVVHWGRYAELFGYNDDSHTFYLDHGDDPEV